MNIPRVNIPRFTLPKLPTKLIVKPLALIAGLSIVARAKIVCSLIVNALTPVQKIYGALTNLSAANAGATIKRTLLSVKNQISNQVSGVVGAAIANVTGAVTTLGNISKSIVDAFKNSGDNLKKQKQSIKNIITDEIDCVKNSLKTSSTAATVQHTIGKETTTAVDQLSNKELKELSENPTKRQEYENAITDKVIDKSTQAISNSLVSNYDQQVIAVDKLAIL